MIKAQSLKVTLVLVLCPLWLEWWGANGSRNVNNTHFFNACDTSNAFSYASCFCLATLQASYIFSFAICLVNSSLSLNYKYLSAYKDKLESLYMMKTLNTVWFWRVWDFFCNFGTNQSCWPLQAWTEHLNLNDIFLIVFVFYNTSRIDRLPLHWYQQEWLHLYLPLVLVKKPIPLIDIFQDGLVVNTIKVKIFWVLYLIWYQCIPQKVFKRF